KYRSFHLFTQRTTIRLPSFGNAADMLEWLHANRVSDVAINFPDRGRTTIRQTVRASRCAAGRDPGSKKGFVIPISRCFKCRPETSGFGDDRRRTALQGSAALQKIFDQIVNPSAWQ